VKTVQHDSGHMDKQYCVQCILEYIKKILKNKQLQIPERSSTLILQHLIKYLNSNRRISYVTSATELKRAIWDHAPISERVAKIFANKTLHILYGQIDDFINNKYPKDKAHYYKHEHQQQTEVQPTTTQYVTTVNIYRQRKNKKKWFLL